MSTYEPRLITPPKEEEEIYPYRRAWRSIVLEMGILAGVMIVAYVIFNLLGLEVTGRPLLAVNLLLVALPVGLWAVFSRISENAAVLPRRRLLTSFTVTALAANAVGIPVLVNILRPDDWLPMQSVVNRIIGYSLTVGVLQEFLKYLVIRFTVWPDYYRVRADAVAYGAATAVGFASVLSLNFVISNPTATPDAVMMRVFAIVSLNIAGSTIVAYGLSETLFSNAIAFLLPSMFVMSAVLSGIGIAMRTTFVNAPLTLPVSTQREVVGIGFSIVLYVGVMIIFYFLFSVARRRELDKRIGQDT